MTLGTLGLSGPKPATLTPMQQGCQHCHMLKIPKISKTANSFLFLANWFLSTKRSMSPTQLSIAQLQPDGQDHYY